jgi:hypothetical protein
MMTKNLEKLITTQFIIFSILKVVNTRFKQIPIKMATVWYVLGQSILK